ncbi:hypothetical protein H4R34_001516 [Dimargaris verticillata]|uniref:Fungal lipase-type domain-containing protein n=1 Tax=Dimargaris verticillata TaxID=2761393 RepID=A0A9W8B5C3_9FUNG|nr:hypothetical protein H4R34_001516 [Dimargaris verticillata]
MRLLMLATALAGFQGMVRVNAAPFIRHQPLPTTSYVLDAEHQGELNEMRLFAKYSAAAYEDVKNWECRACQEFPEIHDTTLVSHHKPEARVHMGFLQSYNTVAELVVNAVSDLMRLYPEHIAVFTGHSLGGALAVLAATQFADLYMDWVHRIKVFTYGQPRIGNEAFALHFSSFHFAKVARVVRDRDLVPHIPPRFLTYRNFNHEYFINPNGLTIACQPDQLLEVTECSASALGNPHFRWGTHHLIYWDVKFWRYMPHALAAVQLSDQIIDAVDALAHADDPVHARPGSAPQSTESSQLLAAN